MEINQYDVAIVNLDPTIGSEIKKTRPCVIISPNEMNKHLSTVIIAPITSQSKSYPTRLQIKHNTATGWVVIDQIRTIDKQRITKVVDKLFEKEIKRLKEIIFQTFVE